MNSLMSRRIRWSSLSNRKPASALHSSVLPTPVGPRNRNEPVGRFGSDRPERERRIALATAAIASSWPTTRSCSLRFHLQQLVALALHQLGDRDAGRARDDLGDLLGADHRAQQLRPAAVGALLLLPSPARPSACFSSSGSLPYCSSATLLKSPLRFSSSICEARAVDLLHQVRRALRGGLLGLPDLVEVGDLALQPRRSLPRSGRGGACEASSFSFLHRRALDLQLDQAAVELVHRLGLGVDLDLDLGRGLVDQVDRLVGQEAVGDVAVARARPRRRSPGR